MQGSSKVVAIGPSRWFRVARPRRKPSADPPMSEGHRGVTPSGIGRDIRPVDVQHGAGRAGCRGDQVPGAVRVPAPNPAGDGAAVSGAPRSPARQPNPDRSHRRDRLGSIELGRFRGWDRAISGQTPTTGTVSVWCSNCVRYSSAYSPPAAISSAWRAGLHDPTAVDHQDLVGAADGGQPVRDHQRRPSLQRGGQRPLHRDLGLAVQVGGRLVEDDDGRRLEQHPRDGQPLLLAAGEPVPAVADHGVQALRHAGHQVPDLRRPQRLRPARPRWPPAGRTAGWPGCVSWNRWASCATTPIASRSDCSVSVPDVEPADPDRARVRRRRPAAPAARSWSCRPRTDRPARPAGPVRRGS